MPRIALLLIGVVILVGYAPGAPPGYEDPDLTPAEKAHWSFQPPTRPPVPRSSDPFAETWVRNSVDAFVLAKLAAKGLRPAPEADRISLIRRVTFDLTGLPPTPAEVDSFLADRASGAYERVVDRLLASPHYGERWAQHWLDAVRFAESNGYEADAERPQAWRYRDYVVRALNSDKPYDRFLTEQVAGDLLAAGKDPRTVPDLWFATGLHRCGPVHLVGGNVDVEANRQEVLTEMVNGLGSAVLGLTIGCARCHDHKFDPLSLGDYYRLQAFFAATQFHDVDLATSAEKDALQKQLLAVSIQLNPLKKQIHDIDAPYHDKLAAEKKARLDSKTRAALDTNPARRSDEQKRLADAAAPLLKVQWDEVLDALPPDVRAQRDHLRARQSEIERDLPRLPPQAWAVHDEKTVPPTHVLKRGDPKRKSIVVGPAYVRVVAGDTPAPKTRLDLARWLTQRDHPLTARVLVNRLWQHHFGRGIVNTPNDFGTRGDRPTHPELLDWLATEFVRPSVSPGEPWSMKRMHRLLVCSATYRQTSRLSSNPEAVKADPDNLLFGRMNRRRLEAEAIRDAVLAAAGTLTRTVGGPSVKVPLEPEVYDLIFTEAEPAGLWPVTPDESEHTRRSLYLLLKRNVRLPILEAFDQPDTLNPCGGRAVSTFAPQALILMNGPFTRAQSRAMANNLLHGSQDPTVRVDQIYRRALGRHPTVTEQNLALEFVRGQATRIRPRLAALRAIGIPPVSAGGVDPADALALADLCLAVINTNEFVYVP